MIIERGTPGDGRATEPEGGNPIGDPVLSLREGLEDRATERLKRFALRLLNPTQVLVDLLGGHPNRVCAPRRRGQTSRAPITPTGTGSIAGWFAGPPGQRRRRFYLRHPPTRSRPAISGVSTIVLSHRGWDQQSSGRRRGGRCSSKAELWRRRRRPSVQTQRPGLRLAEQRSCSSAAIISSSAHRADALARDASVWAAGGARLMVAFGLGCLMGARVRSCAAAGAPAAGSLAFQHFQRYSD